MLINIKMPTYVFENKKTGEVTEKFLSISSKADFLKDNPDLKQIITPSTIIGGTVSVHQNKDGGFNDMMKRIGDANPGSSVDKKYNSRSAKRVAVDKVANKYGYRKG